MHSENVYLVGKKNKKELAHLEEISQKRELVSTVCAEQPWLTINGCRMLNLASNNYLGYAGDERLKKLWLMPYIHMVQEQRLHV